jgi:hypothetical protein
MFRRCLALALPLAVYALVGSSPALASSPFGFKSFSVAITNADGSPDTQAGSHPYAETFAFELNSELREENGIIVSVPAGGEVKDLSINLAPGVIGNPVGIPQCPRRLLDSSPEPTCPANTAIGADKVSLGNPGGVTTFTFPIYNMVPPPGTPAEFGFAHAGAIHGLIDFVVRPGSEQYGLTAHTYNIQQRNVISNVATIWGDPADPSHDAERCENILNAKGEPIEICGLPYGAPPRAFLTLPASCSGPLRFSVAATTWEDPTAPVTDSTETPGMTGCEHFGFAPSLAIAPDTSHADTPAGLTAEVTLPEDPGLTSATQGRTDTDVLHTTVTLPAGVVINPGQAAGLAACQPAQEALEEAESPPSCPAASKVGTDSISTPLLADKLEGDVYVLQSNPPHVQLLVAASGDGVNLKLIGDVHLDPVSGRLTTTFSDTPQFPFTDFKLSFNGGAQAALVTPTACGVYATISDFTPWSSPFTPDGFPGTAFAIDSGPDGSVSCPSQPLPFAPALIAGSSTDQAGGYTDFSMLLQRGDGQQRIERLQFQTPAGLEGMISGVPLCPEPQAAQGTCPAVSQIGHTVVESGPGPYPLVVPEPGRPPAPIYLTGPYEGAPFGLSIVVPVIAGPFNLGTIVTRASIAVDPHTAQITVTTDPLTRIVDGIPTDLRAIDAVIDRPGFMFNPTNCNPMSFSGTASSTEGASAPLSSPFRVGSCRGLPFKPDFKVSTSGKTSKANGASLDAKVIYPTGAPGSNQASSQSNIASVKVDLPEQLPSRLTTLQKACLAAVFEANPAACPAASVIGIVRVNTPVLPVPLTGPVYFVSHGGAAFPDLDIVLQGDGVRVDLIAATFIKAGITSSTFKSTPDVPFSSFELYLPEGPYSALTAYGNLCSPTRTVLVKKKVTLRVGGRQRTLTRTLKETVPAPLVMPTVFTAQNGAVIHQNTPIAVTGCPQAKSKQKAKGGKARKASHRHNGHGGSA